MEHGMNCPHHADKDEACTCAVTERTMHAAWRKRAEEAEAQAKALTAERDAQAEAVRVLGEGIRSVPELITDAILANPIARAAVEGG